MSKLIDEDGEILMTNTERIINKLKEVKEIKGFTLNEAGSHEIDIGVEYWNAEATYDEGLPDIVIGGSNGVIFYDELENALLTDDNRLIVGNLYEFLLS